MVQKVKNWNVFVDLNLEENDDKGFVSVLVRGTKKEVSKLLYKKYPDSHFTMDELPSLVTLKTFEKLIK